MKRILLLLMLFITACDSDSSPDSDLRKKVEDLTHKATDLKSSNNELNASVETKNLLLVAAGASIFIVFGIGVVVGDSARRKGGKGE
jgi:hypothetical protein